MEASGRSRIPGEVDVAVVGAGPVGLSLALALARRGRRVVVLEREGATADHSRAPAIWPGTQEILGELGVLENFLSRGISLETVRLHDVDRERVFLELPLSDLAGETEHARLLILPQSVTERILLEAVRSRSTAGVFFSTPVRSVEQDDRAVGLTCGSGEGGPHVSARFAVGCDGARSTVRRALGLDFSGKTYGMHAALADLRIAGARDLPFPRLSRKDGLAIGIRIEGDVWRLILPFADEPGREAMADRIDRAARRLFSAVVQRRGYERVWQSSFRIHRRISSRFRVGRVALAGDAAHLNSPVGGQGMNAGVRDAAVLAGILDRALSQDDPGCLEEYEELRRTAVDQGVNVFTDRLTRVLLVGRGGLVGPVLRGAGVALKLPSLRRRLLRRIAMID